MSDSAEAPEAESSEGEPPASPPAPSAPPAPPAPPAPIPPPPWRTGTIRNLKGDEVLGLAFYGPKAIRSVGTHLAGGALAALDDLVSMLAAAKYGEVGKRGPAPLPTGIGALRLVHVEFGSAAFYFTSGEGEQFRLEVGGAVEGGVRIADVADELVTLVEARGSEQVLEVARQYSDRVAAKYVQFLEVVVTEGVDTEFVTPQREAELPKYEAGQALAALEQTDHISIEELVTEGVLYEANARTRGFRLVQDDGRLIFGRFEPALYDVVGTAWNHHVNAQILVRVERLARSNEERRTFELVGLHILGPAEAEPPSNA